MKSKLLLVVLILIIAFIVVELFIFSSNSTPPQTTNSAVTIATTPLSFSFPGTFDKIEKTQYGTFAVVMFDSPIGGVTGQAFLVEPPQGDIPFYIHDGSKTQVVLPQDIEKQLQALKDHRYTWTLVLRSPQTSENAVEEYKQTAESISDYLVCNSKFASGYKSGQLGTIVCNPFINEVTK